jgi:hypothetical protein
VRRAPRSPPASSEIDAVAQLPGDIAGEKSTLARARRCIARHGVHQHAHSGREPGVPALGQDAGNGAGEHIAHAGRRHPGIASFAQRRYAPRRAHESARALEHDSAVIASDQAIERSETVVLDIVGMRTEQARRLAGMGCQDPVRPPGFPGFRHDVERIRIDNQRLAGPQYRSKRGAGPWRTAEPGTNGDDVGLVRRLSERLGVGERQTDELRPAGRDRRHVLRRDGDGHQAGADTQTGLTRKANGARHAESCANYQHAAEVAFVR